MSEKGFRKSLQGGLARVFRRRIASPAPSRASSTIQSFEPQDRHSTTETPSHDAANSSTDLDPSSADATAVRATTEEAKETKASATASHVLSPAFPVEPLTGEPPALECEGQQPPARSVSQTLWNAAYDSLEEDADTAELVRSYEKTLMVALDIDSSTDLSAEFKDPIQRQARMRELVEKGQARISTPSSITKGVGDVAQFILSAKPIIDAAIQNIPQAMLPWAGVCVGLQILLNPAKATRSNLAGIVHVVSRMDWYCALSEHLLKKDHIDESLESILPLLQARVIALYKAILLYQMKSVCSYYRHQGLVFLRALANWDDWDGYFDAVRDAENSLLDDWGQFDSIKAGSFRRELIDRAKRIEELLESIGQDIRDFIALQKEMRRDDEDAQCLRDLFVVDPQDDIKKIEQKKDALLDEAYMWILDTEAYAAFTNWSEHGSALSSCRLLWVKGHAGTGKTMLLIGIIRELLSRSAKLAPYVSHFFCQGTESALNSATATLRSLIWLLLVQQPHLISHLRSKHKIAGPSLFQGDSAFIALSSVFESMLKDPDLSPVYFVIDALDECEHGLGDLIKLITSSLSFSDKVKWLVSSRPTVELKTPVTAGSLVELDPQKLEGPVNAYIDHKLSILKTREGYDEGILAKVAVEVRQRAENTFLWVALVFKELDAEDGTLNHVHGMYAVEIIKEIPSGLSKLYNHMMAKIEKGVRKDPEYCKGVLAVATLALRPLSLSELPVLAALPTNMDPRTIVRKCGSFLTTREETVYLIHQSAKDYLDENYTSSLQPAGVAQGHADISRRSIAAMSLILKQNIYNLDFGFKPEGLRAPQPDPLAPIRYSCVFWVDHILNDESSECKRELMDNGAVLKFLKERFLNWIESLSLLGNFSDGVLSIEKLLHTVRSDTSPQLARFLEDAHKFVHLHNWIITQAPLQTYGSALVFSPPRSEVKRAQWKERLPFIKTIAGYKDHWNLLSLLPGADDRDEVRGLAFSPDGKTLVSISNDSSARLWDVARGAHRQTLEGHSDHINAVAFSPDGKTLASASDDGTVRLWYVVTGAHRHPLEGHSDRITAVAFSPDGKTLVSASDDCTVRLWDVVTGAHRHTLGEHSDRITAVAFSLDGKTLASASKDGTVRLWDVARGAHRQTLKGHSDRITAVAFSPDGKTLASASDDGTVRLWDVAMGTHQQTLEGRSKWVLAIAFSPDGKTLASVSFPDRTVRLWDVATGLYRHNIQPHGRRFPHAISDLTFSEDGQYLRTNTGAVRFLSTSVSPNKNLQDHSPLLFDGEWITRDQKGVLWVPSDYPDTSVALHGNTLVLVDQFGGLIFLQFDFS